ncbi:hypothetical protein HOY80DRAFT_73830 [Tuber brumale]|nr:hypothetical protein HOY80DRAFT_73830 [Tuber brumale]
MDCNFASWCMSHPTGAMVARQTSNSLIWICYLKVVGSTPTLGSSSLVFIFYPFLLIFGFCPLMEGFLSFHFSGGGMSVADGAGGYATCGLIVHFLVVGVFVSTKKWDRPRNARNLLLWNRTWGRREGFFQASVGEGRREYTMQCDPIRSNYSNILAWFFIYGCIRKALIPPLVYQELCQVGQQVNKKCLLTECS